MDFFPDVSMYPPECRFSTGYVFANGTNATLYDNTCEGVVDTQFQWMQEFGIDGVIVQRFSSILTDQSFITVRSLYTRIGAQTNDPRSWISSKQLL
jgi:hypothetical protein